MFLPPELMGTALVMTKLMLIAGFFLIFIAFGIREPGLILLGIMLIIMGGIFTAQLSNTDYTTIPGKTWNTTEIQNITSLSADTAWEINGHGKFVLGSGRSVINGQSSHEYTFYKVTPDGYQMGTINAEGVFIRQDEETFPYIERVHQHVKTDTVVYNNTGQVDSIYNGWETDSVIMTVFHVPNGTIMKDYSV
jgi:hypothetical protein